MKKFFIFSLVILVIGIIVMGCGGGATPTTTAPTTTAASAPKTTAPAITSPAATATSPAVKPTATAAPREPVTLTFTTWQGPTSNHVRNVFIPWGQDLEKRSNGQLKIKFYLSGAMGSGHAAQYDVVRTGMADIGFASAIAMPGQFPLTDVAALPMLFTSNEALDASMTELTMTGPLKQEWKDVKVLCVQGAGIGSLNNNGKAVRRLEDLKGLKTATSVAITVKAIEALGGIPQFIESPEQYTAIERGMVDGCFSSWNETVVFKQAEVTKYRTNVDLDARYSMIVMNLNSWARLPPDLQKILEEATGIPWAIAAGKIMDGIAAKSIEDLNAYDKKIGNPGIYFLPDDEKARFKAAVKPVLDTWVKDMEGKGLPGKALMDGLQSMVRKYSK